MQCNVCGKSEASIHLTEIVNNNMVELHLCERCAQEKGGELNPQFSFGDLLSGLADISPMIFRESNLEGRCTTCGLSIGDLGKTGRLGCPDCYQSLGKALLPLIQRVQRSTRHIGKKPSRIGVKQKHQVEVRELEEKLRKYVQEENYEGAAQVRDQIRKLQVPSRPRASGKEKQERKSP